MTKGKEPVGPDPENVSSNPDAKGEAVQTVVNSEANLKPSDKRRFEGIKTGARKVLDVITLKGPRDRQRREAQELKERIEFGGKVREREDGGLDFSPNAGMMYQAFANGIKLAMHRNKTVYLEGNNSSIYLLSPEKIEERMAEFLGEGLQDVPQDAYICYDEEGSTVRRFTTAAKMAIDGKRIMCFAGKNKRFYRVDPEEIKNLFEKIRKEFLQA